MSTNWSPHALVQPLSERTARSTRVFGKADRALYIILTGARLSVFGFLLLHWFSYRDWLSFPVSFWLTTALLLLPAVASQLRWSLLPSMRRPSPLPVSPLWRVAVVTTFVPGAEPIEMLEDELRAMRA